WRSTRAKVACIRRSSTRLRICTAVRATCRLRSCSTRAPLGSPANTSFRESWCRQQSSVRCTVLAVALLQMGCRWPVALALAVLPILFGNVFYVATWNYGDALPCLLQVAALMVVATRRTAAAAVCGGAPLRPRLLQQVQCAVGRRGDHFIARLLRSPAAHPLRRYMGHERRRARRGDRALHARPTERQRVGSPERRIRGLTRDPAHVAAKAEARAASIG